MDSDKIFITKFDTTAQYNAAKDSLAKPHVSLTKDDGKLHYMKELSVTVTINITQTSSATPICNNTENVTNIIIDGEDIGNVVEKYSFSTTGIHTIKFLLSTVEISDEMFYGAEIWTEMDDYEPMWPQIPITTAVMSDGITIIGSNAFADCHSLSSVTIGNYVNTIDSFAFEECPGLSSITFPKSVKTIRYNTLRCEYYTSSLSSIICLGTTPPSIFGSTFSNTNNCPIFVPDESVNAYKTAANWSTYASRIHAMSDYDDFFADESL